MTWHGTAMLSMFSPTTVYPRHRAQVTQRRHPLCVMTVSSWILTLKKTQRKQHQYSHRISRRNCSNVLAVKNENIKADFCIDRFKKNIQQSLLAEAFLEVSVLIATLFTWNTSVKYWLTTKVKNASWQETSPLKICVLFFQKYIHCSQTKHLNHKTNAARILKVFRGPWPAVAIWLDWLAPQTTVCTSKASVLWKPRAAANSFGSKTWA